MQRLPHPSPSPRGALTDLPGIPPRARWPERVGRHVLPRCASTNAEALRLVPMLAGPAWILALEQFAGRGRRGRIWHMPAGNFAASLALKPQGGPAGASLYSFVAALALHDALALACGPSARLAIKWPNDVLLNGGKVAGILLESAGTGQELAALAVGIGVNLAASPSADQLEEGAVPAVSVLGETGHAVAPGDFLDILAPAFAHWQAQLESRGFAPIRAAWLARAAGMGQPVTARTGSVSRRGIFEGIDQQGALMLRMAAGCEIIPAADIHFDGAC
ncbi:biotin--[acetyl-CoA-carboxylase] ligase [Paracoccus contaminans]|uniref:biotin--[biotin carboxyl-carrier protein] ligase n=1 Tax=Paracoccus contaminans TaxID=1945662 RepID=A0A1W6CUH8_9RHOB|nr:biotin--[acetyl-CoA-carboxylase] ligase [Paracoccus contaminans]